VLPLSEAAELLRLPPTAVEALVGSGYLVPSAKGPTGPEFTLPDLKAFLARNADNGSGNLWRAEPHLDDLGRVDPQDLLDALDDRADEMARRVFDIFSTVFPEAATWRISKQARFIEQARSRFEAILAVTGQGAEVDEALVGDLQEVGASAASAGSPLPQLLVILRISRDLVVQTAVELAEERSRHWGLALSLLLTRVLPAMDRLTDALAQGYWAAIFGREQDGRTRYQNLVDRAVDGVYDVDLDGKVQYANPSLARILGYRLEQLEGAQLSDVIRPLDPSVSVESLLVDRDDSTSHTTMVVSRADGVRRVLEIQTVPRRASEDEGSVVGFQGIVRDETAGRGLESSRNELLAVVSRDLMEMTTTLEPDAAGRVASLAEALYDVSRLEVIGIRSTPRPVDLASVVETALGNVADTASIDDVEVRVPGGVTVLADPRRLAKVVAELVGNAIRHGAPPVVVEAVGVVGVPEEDKVVLVVGDAGGGVSEALAPTLFSGLHTLGVHGRLVEDMGGHLWYERVPGGGASFRLIIPTLSRRL
jgi:PAS domain S-box-containing protein